MARIKVKRFLLSSSIIFISIIFVSLGFLIAWICRSAYLANAINEHTYYYSVIGLIAVILLGFISTSIGFYLGRNESKYLKVGFYISFGCLILRVCYYIAFALARGDKAVQTFAEILESLSYVVLLIFCLLSIEAYQEVFSWKNQKKLLRDGKACEYVIIMASVFAIIVDSYTNFYVHNESAHQLVIAFNIIGMIAFFVSGISYLVFYFHGIIGIERRFKNA